MPLKRAINTGGDYLDLKELAKDGPVLVVFRIREFHAAEKGDFGPALPVTCDVLICSGPRAGEVIRQEQLRYAITTTLRGVRNPKNGEPIPAPTTAVGDDIATRVKVINAGKPNAGAVGDEPSDAEVGSIELYYRDGAGFAADGDPALATAGAPAGGDGASASAGEKMPWDE